MSRSTTRLGQSRDHVAASALSQSSSLIASSFTRYSDSEFEYRHVQLPKAMLKAIPKEYHDSSKGTLKLLWEDEWRSMGITQVCNASKRAGYTKLWRRDRWKDTDTVFQVLIRPFSQSLGWEHYEVHEPEPHILLFKYVCVSSHFRLRLCASARLVPALAPGSQTANTCNRRPLNYQPPAQ